MSEEKVEPGSTKTEMRNRVSVKYLLEISW